MAYFKIGTTDISPMVNKLDINEVADYVLQKNAGGNKKVDYIATKRTITVGIIPLDDDDMADLKALLSFGMTISFRDPETQALSSNVSCILPENNISYYTIQTDNVIYNAMKLVFEEL